jgi:hypothetical protein
MTYSTHWMWRRMHYTECLINTNGMIDDANDVMSGLRKVGQTICDVWIYGWYDRLVYSIVDKLF